MRKFKLKQLLSIKNGRDHKELNSGNIPIYGSGGIMRYGEKAIYNYESILLPRKGTLSNIQYVNKPFWTVDTIYYSIVNKELANPFYLFNFLKLLDLSKLNIGTGVPSMTFDSYYNLDIYLPELSIQQKIAAVLSALDAKIELNNRINAELEKMAKTIYDYWFVQFDFPDANGKPYKSSGGKMVWSNELKREIPDGWEVKEVKDFLNVITGKEDANFAEINGKYPFFTCGEEVLKCNKSKFKGKAILVAGNGNFNVKYFDGEFNAYQRTYVLIPSEVKYVGIIFRNVFENISKFKISSNGSIVKFIRKEDVEKIKVILPKDNLKILEILSQNIDFIQKNNQQNQTLANLRDWLLPMLMNGQVKVK